jgi:hypothetical protein
MRFGGRLAACLLAAIVALTATPAPARLHQNRAPTTKQELKHQAQVRREMRAGMRRERARHHARMTELAHRDRMAHRTKDLDEQQRVRDLVMAERLLFAQRMRDLRAKAPEPR